MSEGSEATRDQAVDSAGAGAEEARKTKEPPRRLPPPLCWVRWKVVIGLAVIVAALMFFGIDPLCHWKVNDLGTSAEHGASWRVGDLDLGILSGDFDFADVLVATPREKGRTTEKNRAFSADALRIDFDAGQALRRRLHGSIHIDAPRLLIKRYEDGSINVGDLGGDGEAAPPSESTDWVGAIEHWLEKLREWEKKRRERKRRERGEPPEPGKPVPGEEDRPFEVDYARRVTYPFADITRFVAETIEGSGLEIRFADEATRQGAVSIPPVTDGRIAIENLSEKPSVHSEPISWEISGKLGEAEIGLKGTLDLRPDASGAARNELGFTFRATGFPLALAAAFASDSLPVVFESGTVDVEARISLGDWERIDIAPSLRFKQAVVRPAAGKQRIAGTDANRFCELFNDAARQLDVLEILDLRVTGTYARPRVEVGDTLTHLVESGAKAFVRGQIDRGVEKGRRELDRVIEKNLGGSKEARDAVDQAGELLKGVKGLDGLFGDEKKKKD